MGGDERHYTLVGWLSLAARVLVFLAEGIRARSLLTIGGSVLFLAGIVAFLVPLLKDR
jgi:hypothetical protein